MASSSSSSSINRASSSRSWKYDVFLSFRGEDTRKTYVDHLYSELVERLIHTYKDDKTLPRGDSINPSLMKAIEESRIAIVIFSSNYADSSWCLDELTHIMKCRDVKGQIVMPIFYNMDPSDVRKQKGEFGKAFAKKAEENTTKVESWRKALVDASNLAGWEPKNTANGHESQGIKQIVDTILDKLFSLKSSYADKGLVGMGTRSQLLKSQLKIGSRGVRMVGIWGYGGGGKTTLASFVYTEVSHHFGGHCFVENIREESSKHGLKYLQGKILKTLLKINVEVQSVEEGKRMIKRRLCHSNVLLVLDDVDHVEQLEALAGKHDWFGDKSRIIITTRNEHLLKAHKIDEVSRVCLLLDREAIALFRIYAYRKKKPVEDYEKLSRRVISYAAGLPLALKVLGKFLYDKDKNEWMSTLARLEEIPEMEIMEKLKISYDALIPLEKELFLDIACFFRGKVVDEAMTILDACGFHPGIGIRVLRQKALITISNGRFDMHDLVQEMGHYIVQGEHPDNPEEHSRLWQTKVIDDMCFGDATEANDKVKAIIYDGHLSHFPELVSKMKKLRFLQVSSYQYDFLQGPNFLSNELRVIRWPYYPASPLPEKFHPTKLAGLDMYCSLQKEVWKGYKHLPNLKKLQLHNLKNLHSTPDLDGLPCLEKLSVFECPSLEEIHPSLGNHKNVVKVSIDNCEKLRIFPTIIRMEKLKTLQIHRCCVLLKFPEIRANMVRLVKLSLNDVGIEVFPSSIGEHCTSLITLNVVDCHHLKIIEGNFHALKYLKELTVGGFPQLNTLPMVSLFDEKCCLEKLRSSMNSKELSVGGWGFFGFHHMRSCLRKLDLGGCRLEGGEIPSDIGELYNIQELDLSRNKISRLHFSLSQLTRLKLLILTGCKILVELPDLPSSIAIIMADECFSLSSVGNGHVNCKWLSQVYLEGNNVTGANRLLGSMLQGAAIGNHSMILQVGGVEIPKMFTPMLSGKTCTLQLPSNWCNDFSGFLMCAVLTFSYEGPLDITMAHRIQKAGTQKASFNHTRNVSTWVGYVPFASLRHTEWWDSTSNTVSFSVDFNRCTEFGVRLVPRKRGSGSMETPPIITDSSEYGHGYRHKFKIKHDSKSTLKISLNMRIRSLV